MKSNFKIQALTMLSGLILGGGFSQAAVTNLGQQGELSPCPGGGRIGAECAVFMSTVPLVTSVEDSSVDFDNEEAQARLAAEVIGAAEPFLIPRLAQELGVQRSLVKKSILTLSQKSLPLTQENILLQLEELVSSQK
jgi:hypothetical protein